jgi:PhoPQ-activated pathogenicity-related protein
MLEHRCLLSITPSSVVGRFAFYDNSVYDGGIPGVNSSDDSAIASDKSALLSGSSQATFANLTSYSRGINGIMVDISGSHSGITANDFTFKVGNNNMPNSWTTAPPPTSVTVRAGAGGVGGSDRVEIIWLDKAIQNEWLQVNVAADRNTGLGTSDVFFFGSEIGDTGLFNTATVAKVGAIDVTATQNHVANLNANIPDTNLYDFNRDGQVGAVDITLAQIHATTNSTGLQLFSAPAISPPALSAALANDTGSSNSDGITSDCTVAGTLTDTSGITSFKAGLNNGPVNTDALPLVQSGGAFTLSPSFLATVNGGSLPDGAYTLHLQAVDSQGLSAALDLAFTLSTVAPTVTVATMASFTSDVTPHVTVTASDPQGLANGTQVNLDVDLNNDGNFTGSGELGRTQSTLYAGGSYFQMTPALPATDPMAGPYLVQLRARVTDLAGNVGYSPLQSLKVDTLGNNILQNYLNNGDTSSNATHLPTPTTFTGAGYTLYVYDLISQTWRTTADVDKPVWHHWLQVVVPTGTLSPTALLLIDGGNNTSAAPTSTNPALVQDALMFHAVTIDLPDVPSEPLTFTGDPGHPRSEDAILAYSFNQYTTHLDANGNPLPGYESWPALLPMVKSAVRAMDAVQSVVPTVSNFVVTGYSKRGWTTWLTAAADNRVVGIIPGVFDVLNLGEQMMHHYSFYSGIPAGPTFATTSGGSAGASGFSASIQDYVGFNIPESVQTLGGQELGRVVDPYRYLNNGHFNIPKLELNSTGDEFFIPDSAQYYFSDLPGTENYLRYIPNTGHPLNATDTANSTASFYNAVINNLQLPQFTWTVQQDGSIRVKAITPPTNVVMWQATTPTYRDFRHGYNSNASIPVYNSSTLTDQGNQVYIASVPTPATGATAFFVQLTFPNASIPSDPYVFTTEIKVVSNIPLASWPFYTAVNAAPPPPSAGPPDLSAIASGLPAPTALAAPPPPLQPSTVSTKAANGASPTEQQDAAADSIVDDWAWLEPDRTTQRDSNSSSIEATDLALASLTPGSLL